MEQIPVQFEAREAGRGEPTWGQKELWGVGGHEGRHVTFGGAAPMAPGIGLEAVVGSLEYLAGRHQTLRTRFLVDSERRLQEQILHARGEIGLLVVNADDDPELAAQQTAVAFDQEPFDCTQEWPLRMAVILKDKELTHTVAVYNHMALDGRGLDVLLANLLGGAAAQNGGGAPAGALEPLQQAAWQTSAAGRRQTTRALKHWDRILRAVPARRFPRQPGETGAYTKLIFDSPAADLAADAIARRTRQSVGHILLAAYAIAVERMTRVNPTVLRVVVDNRFRPGLADSVSAVSQFGLCAIDVRGADFDTVLARTMSASLDTYMNAYYDPEERQNLIEAIGRDRGEPVGLDSCYNDRRRGVQSPPGDGAGPDHQPAPSPAALREAADRGVMRWEPWTAPNVPVGESLYVHIDDAPGRILFTICADSAYLTAEDLELCARTIEETLVAAALE